MFGIRDAGCEIRDAKSEGEPRIEDRAVTQRDSARPGFQWRERGVLREVIHFHRDARCRIRYSGYGMPKRSENRESRIENGASRASGIDRAAESAARAERINSAEGNAQQGSRIEDRG
jgi:hypothetical protein